MSLFFSTFISNNFDILYKGGERYSMSSKISGTSITLTRGDTLKVLINLFKDEQPYTPVAGDRIRFALKHNVMNSKQTEYKDVEPLILKQIPIDTRILELEPEDTKSLGFGTYVYDIQITFADGTVDTFITEALFKLTPEVE